MILNETYKLENGLSIPKLGLGTWFIDDDQAAEAVRTAVKLGYRLIDTAQAYGNERGVGEGVRTCGLPRRSCSSPARWRRSTSPMTRRRSPSTRRWKKWGFPIWTR